MRPFKMSYPVLSGYSTWDMITRIGKTTLLSDVAGIVKTECCTCAQGQVLQQNHRPGHTDLESCIMQIGHIGKT